MINELNIKNFLGHKNTNLIFDKGVNVIIGLPQAGKSSIIRALNLLRTNRPLGSSYHSNFSKSPVEISAIINNKKLKIKKVIKDKKLKSTEYSCNEHKCSSVGTNVPEAITNIINMNDINIQNQLDSPFMILDTGGKIAKEFNRIIKAEDSDKWITNISKKISKFNHEKIILNDDIENIQKEINKLEGIEDLKNQMRLVEELNKEISYLEQYLISLQNINTNLSNIRKSLSVLKKINKLDKYLKIIDEIDEKLNELIIFENLMYEYEDINKEIDELSFIGIVNTKLKRVKSIELNLAFNISEKEIMETILKYENDIEHLTAETGLIIGEYKNKLKKNKICPTCFSKINPKIIDDLEI